MDIDIRELRVGNIVDSAEYGRLIIDEIYTHRGNELSCQELKSRKGRILPLSYVFQVYIDEFLLRCLGFKKEVDEIIYIYYYNICVNNYFIRISKYSNTLGRYYNIHIDNQVHDSIYSCDIQYLHQLQNAIYDATGEELDVKDLFK